MKIAILSDIHGNLEAFKTCIDYCKNNDINEYVFLGDYLGEFAYPEKTMELIYEIKDNYKCTFIRGNKEDYWIHHDAWKSEKWQSGSSTTGCLYYVKNRISQEDLAFFENLNIAENLEYAGLPNITVCHGSPFSNSEKMIPDDEKSRAIISKCDNDVIFCGHTHRQFLIKQDGKQVINPGAVGVPLYSGGKTQFAILSDVDDKWKIDFVQLQYDVEKMVSAQIEAGIDKIAPYWWKVTNHLLHGGLYSLGGTMRKVLSHPEATKGNFEWPDIPEEVWKETYEEIFGKEELMSYDVYDQKREKDFPVRLDSKLIYECKWMSLFCDRVQMPEGNIIETYHRVHDPSESVEVVIVNDNNEILLIQSKRYTTSRMEWEIPAGSVDEGECPEEAARRECMEETGYNLDKLTYMCCSNPSNGFTDTLIHYFIARVGKETNRFDSNEVKCKRWVKKDEVLYMLKNNETKCGFSAHGLLHAIMFYM